MIPYTTLLYFCIVFYIAIPTLILALIGNKRLLKAWFVAATAIMLGVQYWIPGYALPSVPLRALWMVCGYAIGMWVVGRLFLMFRLQKRSPYVFYAVIFFGLLPLCLNKIGLLLDPANLIGFIGISYVTFRVLDTFINIEDGVITELPFLQFLLFLLFFPTVSSGPIDRYKRFQEDWQRIRTRGELLTDIDGAIAHIFRGLLYSFIIAALIKQYWLTGAASGTGLLSTISYMYAYSLYLFFDFAGYSAFAIGISYLFGIHTPENFNRPFLAHNIRDFWNRWHISLSFWFRDHVYSRFVLSALKNKWFKNERAASYAGYAVSMGLMGAWHGLTWYFILYGFYQAVLLILYDVFNRWNKKRAVTKRVYKPLSDIASVLITFNLVCFGFLLFSGHLANTFTTLHDPSINSSSLF